MELKKQDVIQLVFGNRIRLRACGILENQNGILLIKHLGIGPKGHLWAPPGGEPNFGESVSDAVVREFKEETGLDVFCGDFVFYNEFIGNGLHAVELFFKVIMVSGELQIGYDPELPKSEQLMSDIRFWKANEIAFEQPDTFHRVCHILSLN